MTMCTLTYYTQTNLVPVLLSFLQLGGSVLIGFKLLSIIVAIEVLKFWIYSSGEESATIKCGSYNWCRYKLLTWNYLHTSATHLK